jgi:hypothetical protein
MFMMRRGREPDPMTDRAAFDVLAAYEVAERAGLGSVDCYRAGVEAWRRAHPDQTRTYAAGKAVTVILAKTPAPGLTLRTITPGPASPITSCGKAAGDLQRDICRESEAIGSCDEVRSDHPLMLFERAA